MNINTFDFEQSIYASALSRVKLVAANYTNTAYSLVSYQYV